MALADVGTQFVEHPFIGGIDVYAAVAGTVSPHATTPAFTNGRLPALPAAFTQFGQGTLAQENAELILTDSFQKQPPALGETVSSKVYRISEEQQFKFMLRDYDADIIAYLLDDRTVRTTAATTTAPGFKTFGIERGAVVNYLTLVVRGTAQVGPDNPEELDWELWFPRGHRMSEFRIPFTQTYSETEVIIDCLKHPTLGVGDLWKAFAPPTA